MWAAKYEKILRGYCSEVGEDLPLDPDTPLTALGFGSMQIVGLIVDLEDEFGLQLPETMLTPAIFATPATLWAALAEHLGLSDVGGT
jgi:acyl carrier protein